MLLYCFQVRNTVKKIDLANAVVRLLKGTSEWITFDTRPQGYITFTVAELGDVNVYTQEPNSLGKKRKKGMCEAAKEVGQKIMDANLEYGKNSPAMHELKGNDLASIIDSTWGNHFPPKKLNMALHPNIESALDEIDAAVFSGDSFYNQENIARIHYFMDRWKKELGSIKEVIDSKELKVN